MVAGIITDNIKEEVRKAPFGTGRLQDKRVQGLPFTPIMLGFLLHLLSKAQLFQAVELPAQQVLKFSFGVHSGREDPRIERGRITIIIIMNLDSVGWSMTIKHLKN